MAHALPSKDRVSSGPRTRANFIPHTCTVQRTFGLWASRRSLRPPHCFSTASLRNGVCEWRLGGPLVLHPVLRRRRSPLTFTPSRARSSQRTPTRSSKAAALLGPYTEREQPTDLACCSPRLCRWCAVEGCRLVSGCRRSESSNMARPRFCMCSCAQGCVQQAGKRVSKRMGGQLLPSEAAAGPQQQQQQQARSRSRSSSTAAWGSEASPSPHLDDSSAHDGRPLPQVTRRQVQLL